MKFRQAQSEDAESISALIAAHLPLLTLRPDGAGAEAFLRSIAAEAIRGYIESTRFDYAVAEIDGRIVGVVAVRDRSHLYHLFVAFDQQGRHIARRLWEHARQRAAGPGGPTGFTVNSSPGAVPVYRHFGFVPTGPRIEQDGIAFIPMRWSE